MPGHRDMRAWVRLPFVLSVMLFTPLPLAAQETPDTRPGIAVIQFDNGGSYGRDKEDFMALERGIPVAVTPFGVSDRVAQHGFTLTLMLLRRMHVAIDALERRLNPEELQELPADTGGQNTINWARLTDIQSLNDKTIGIIGFGEIGACLARMLPQFHRTCSSAPARRPTSA